jgi:hypothetical protein
MLEDDGFFSIRGQKMVRREQKDAKVRRKHKKIWPVGWWILYI